MSNTKKEPTRDRSAVISKDSKKQLKKLDKQIDAVLANANSIEETYSGYNWAYFEPDDVRRVAGLLEKKMEILNKKSDAPESHD